MLYRLQLYFHTVRFLKPIQIFARIWFRLYTPSISKNNLPIAREISNEWHLGPRSSPTMLDENKFLFLNKTGSLAEVDGWNGQKKDKLWLYNLHYFDDLNAEASSSRETWHRNLIEKWIRDNQLGLGNGWEPYPTSLRIVNWIKWVARGNELNPNWRDSLALQSRYLYKRIEYHILGNHLFANAKALVFAGLFFSGREADLWFTKGLKILKHEVNEQVLPDGGHFELSPMYHAIIIEDLLDLINVHKVFDRSRTDTTACWHELVPKMLDWLATMTHPDGGHAFFNDTTLGISSSEESLRLYGANLGLNLVARETPKLTHLKESGYVRYHADAMMTIMDVGEIGAEYIPGHAHADSLSFETSLFGKRLLVNSGISEYGIGEPRAQQRGTAAHNTLEIDGQNSSEVWSGFRVARRAKPKNLMVSERGETLEVICSHDGYLRLPGRPIHQRRWFFSKQSMLISDVLEGEYKKAKISYHLHPTVEVDCLDGSNTGRFNLKGGQIVNWSVTGGEVSIVRSKFNSGFGLSEDCFTIEINMSSPMVTFEMLWSSS